MLNFDILYLLLLTIHYSTFGFTLDIKISTCYLTYFAKFNFLCFISTPSNRLPVCVWFYLRYKIRKIIQSAVLSFLGVLKVANFLLPSLSQFSFYCWVENQLSGYSPPIMQIPFACFSGCAYCVAWHWGILQKCTLGSYRVLHSISINIRIKYLLVLYKLIPLLSVFKLVTSTLKW